MRIVTRVRRHQSLTLSLFAATLILAGQAAHAQSPQAPTETWAFQSDSASSRNISGVWLAKRKIRHISPIGKSPIPFTARGAREYAANKVGLVAGRLIDRTRDACLPAGVPRIMSTDFPLRIVQASGRVVMMFEENRSSRIIRSNATHHDPKTWDPAFMGDAIATWDGDTLVIDTNNFKAGTFLDETGLPHGDRLSIRERVRKIPSRQQLEVLATINDPETYTRPWTVRYLFDSRPDLEIKTDWVCGEPHRDLLSVQKEIVR